jgi:hypothetical protein
MVALGGMQPVGFYVSKVINNVNGRRDQAKYDQAC